MNEFFFLFILLAAGAGAYYWFSHQPRSLAVINPLRGPAVQAVYATGTVEPTIMLPIAPRSGTRLMALLVDEGHEIKKGEVLAQLEDTDIQKTIDELKARLELAQRDYARMQILAKSRAISSQELDQARAEQDAAQATLERAQAEQSYQKLFAPEDGRIIRRDGEVGEFIPAGQTVFWIECCAPLRITTEVDEEDIALVKPGQKVLIRADAFPGEVFEGQVSAITPKGDSVSRSYRVRIGLGADTPLMTGMTAETNIMTRKTEDALLIPSSALILSPQEAGSASVWSVQNNTLQLKTIKTGIKTSDVVEVISGIAENETIIVDPPSDLEEGMSVTTHNQPWQVQVRP